MTPIDTAPADPTGYAVDFLRTDTMTVSLGA